MSKQLILEYLQKHSLELIEQYPDIVEVQYASKPSRILIVAKQEMDAPEITFQDKTIKVEVAVNEYVEEPEVAGEDPNVTAWRKRNPIKPQGIVDNVVDVSPTADRAKSREAYEAWRKRHPGVKKVD